MRLKIFSPAFALILLFSLSGPGMLKAQAPGEVEEAQKVKDNILLLDSLFWEAYNNCEVHKYEPFFTNDLEFYHDKGGITKSLDKLLEISKNGMCGNEDWRLRRELVKGSLRFFPLKNNGEFYGAILSGEHLFFVNENGKEEHLDGIALFTHLWLLQEGEWKMARVLSYDHRPATHNPNQEKEIGLSDKALLMYVGEYEATPTRTIVITQESGTLKLQDGNFRTSLYPMKENAFFMKERDVQFEFVKDDQDQVLRMVVRENGEIVDGAEKVKTEKMKPD